MGPSSEEVIRAFQRILRSTTGGFALSAPGPRAVSFCSTLAMLLLLVTFLCPPADINAAMSAAG